MFYVLGPAGVGKSAVVQTKLTKLTASVLLASYLDPTDEMIRIV
jgi:guanylate kinase